MPNGRYTIQKLGFMLGELKSDIKNLHDKMDMINKEGCRYGREVRDDVQNHKTGHKVAYVIFGAILTVIGVIMSVFK